MKKVSKTAAIVLAVMMAMSLSACGSKDETPVTTETEVTETEVEVAEAETTEATTETTTEAKKADATTEAKKAQATTAAPKPENKTEAPTTEAQQAIPAQDPAVTEGYVGFHPSNSDASSFEISQGSNGYYNVNISIASLSSFACSNATFASMKMSFTATDQDGNPISGMIYRESNGTFTIEFTSSTWEYIKNGDKYTNFE